MTLCVCECSREHSRVYVQQETSYLQHYLVGIIQYWEGTPPRVLISVLLIQNIPKKKIYSLQEYFEPKYSSKEKPERATF